MRRLLALAAGLGLCANAAPGLAHQQTATFGDVTRAAGPANDATVSWRLRVRSGDLAVALRGRHESAASYLGAGLAVTADGQSCAPASSTLARDPAELEPTLVFVQRWSCPARAESLRLRYDLFFDDDSFHESFTRIALGHDGPARGEAAPITVVFRDGLREITIAADEAASPWQNGKLYLRLGVTHILTGYDHLSFLMALLLAAGLRQRTAGGRTAAAASVRQAVGGTVTIVSAFTIAHSLTLVAQVLRPGWISTRWVEPAIAFSVAYVGFENLIPRPPRGRWLLVFGFGLVHGLGFASVLREIGLPRRGLVLSLLSFNLGVEIGQLMVVAVAFPIIIAAARRAPRRFERWGLQAGSAVIAAFGAVWLVARLAAR